MLNGVFYVPVTPDQKTHLKSQAGKRAADTSITLPSGKRWEPVSDTDYDESVTERGTPSAARDSLILPRTLQPMTGHTESAATSRSPLGDASAAPLRREAFLFSRRIFLLF